MAQRRICRDITETMGDTPLIQLNRVGAGLPARIVVYERQRNRHGSHAGARGSDLRGNLLGLDYMGGVASRRSTGEQRKADRVRDL